MKRGKAASKRTKNSPQTNREKPNETGQSLDERIRLADERTNWAYERTLLANERTFTAWIRTGLGAVAAGIGIVRLLESAGESPIPRAIGCILLVVGGLIYSVALWRYSQRYREMKLKGMKVTPLWLLTALVLSLTLGAALALLLLLGE